MKSLAELGINRMYREFGVDEDDRVLINEARLKKFELDKAAVPFDDASRTITVNEDTKAKWRQRRITITHICGLKVL